MLITGSIRLDSDARVQNLERRNANSRRNDPPRGSTSDGRYNDDYNPNNADNTIALYAAPQKYDGFCYYCDKRGHKAAVCKQKIADEGGKAGKKGKGKKGKGKGKGKKGGGKNGGGKYAGGKKKKGGRRY